MYFGRPVCLPCPAAAWSVARNVFRASSMPAPPRCRPVSCPKFISDVQYACPAPLPPGQLPEIHFGCLVCLPCPAAAWSVARNSFRVPGVPALPRCRLVSCPKFISGVQCACSAPLPPGQSPEIHFGRPVCLPCPPAAWCACPAPLPPGQLPEIHFGRPVCLPCPAAAWSVARNSFRASSVPALPPCRLVCLPRPAAAWSVARNSFRASSMPALPRCRLVSRPKFISGVQYACPAPLRQLPEIHCGRPVCLPRPAASVARNSFRASSVPAPPGCRLVSCPKFISGVQCACPAPLRQLPEIHFGRPVCLPRPAASVARNSLRASSMPAPPRCVSRPKFIAGVQYACPAPLPVARNSLRASSMPALPRCRPAGCPKCISGVQYACPAPLPPCRLPEMYFGRPVCLPCPAAAWSVARNSFRASSVPAPLRCRLVSRPKFISGVQCACPAPLPPCRLPEMYFGRPVCLPCPAAAWSVARNVFRASSMPAPPRCRPVSCPKFISDVQYACPAPLPPGQLPEIHFGCLVCLPCPAAAWSVARNSFRASSVPAPLRCRLVSRPKFISGVQCACPAPLPPGVPAPPRCRLVSCPKFISGVQCACPAPLRQLPEIHFGRPVCLPRPAASVARNSLRASSMPAPPRCVSRPKFIAGVQYACPAPLPVARNSLRASSVPAPPRCVSRPKFIAGVQCACPAPLRQSPEIHCGRPVCLPRPAAAWSVTRNVFRAPGVPAPPRYRLVSCPKFISGVQCACPAPLPPGQLPEMYFGRLVCLPRPAAAWSVARNVISGVRCACPAPLPQRTIFTPPAPAAI
jgi:hypothetical protein